MRKNFIVYFFILWIGSFSLSSCNKEEDKYPSETGHMNPASIESTSFQLYMPLEANTYSGMFSIGLGMDSLKVTSTGGGKFVPGARGFAFKSDSLGISYITVPMKASSFVRKLKEFTLSFWLAIPDTSKKIASIILVDGGDNLYGALSVTIDSLNLNGRVNNTATDSTYTVSVLKKDLKINEWNHIVFSYDSTASRLSLYVDGKLTKEATCVAKSPSLTPMGPLSLSSAMNNIYLGAWTQQIKKAGVTPTMDFFRGKLDEVRIWSKCLSEDEVLTLSQAEHVLAQIP